MPKQRREENVPPDLSGSWTTMGEASPALVKILFDILTLQLTNQ